MRREFSIPVRSILVVFTFMAAYALAQEPSFKLSGQVRQRFEQNGKDFIDSTEVSGATALRTRINLAFTTAAGDQALVQVQDTRTYGTETNTLSDGSADILDFHQAYYKVNNIAGVPLSFKVGRMELAFANQRLIGAVGWHNIGRSFDGTAVSFVKGKIKVDGFYMKEVEKQLAAEADDKDFRGVWLDSKWKIPGLVNPTNLDAYLLNQYQNKGETLNATTAGIFTKGNYGQVGGITVTQEFDFALQMGTQNDTTDIKASLIGLRVGVALTQMPFKPTVGFGYDKVSGNDAGTPENEAFNTLYATNHKFYGFMDYFLNVPAHAKGYGLKDIILSGGLTPMAGMGIKFAYHIFSTDKPVTLTSGDATDIGTEIDITANYGFRKGFAIVGGYSIFTPKTVFEAWQGTDAASWAYLMTIFNF